jgi:hypothetical protein
MIDPLQPSNIISPLWLATSSSIGCHGIGRNGASMQSEFSWISDDCQSVVPRCTDHTITHKDTISQPSAKRKLWIKVLKVFQKGTYYQPNIIVCDLAEW